MRLVQLSLVCRLLGSPGHQGMALLFSGPLASCQVLLVVLVASASLVMPIQAAALQLPALTPGGSVSCAVAGAIAVDQRCLGWLDQPLAPDAQRGSGTHVGPLHQALGGGQHQRVSADQARPLAQLRLAERGRLGLGQRLLRVQHHLEGAGAGGQGAGGACGRQPRLAALVNDAPHTVPKQGRLAVWRMASAVCPGRAGTHRRPGQTGAASHSGQHPVPAAACDDASRLREGLWSRRNGSN